MLALLFAAATSPGTFSAPLDLLGPPDLLDPLDLPDLLDLQQPADRSQLEAMAHRATDRIRALQREADELAARERTLLVDLRRLEVERQIKVEELKQSDAESQDIARKLNETNAEVAQLEQTVVAQRPGVANRLVGLYKLGRPGYARLLLSVDDLRGLGRAYRMVSAVAELDRQRVAEHQRTLEALRATQASLQERQAQAAKLQEEGRRTRQALDRAVGAHTQLVRAIDTQRDLNAQLIGELQIAQQRLQASLAELGTGLPPVEAPAVLPLRSFQGDLDWPVTGKVTTRFGRHHQTRFGTTIVRNGIDIGASEGAPVHAAHAGRVAFAEAFTGFGNLVILDHGNQAFSLYGYLASLNVQAGDHVDRRDVVGTVGRGPTGPPALYFELRIDGKPVDPLQWLKQR